VNNWHYWLGAIVIGYILGYYFRGVGNMTVGKLYPST
jgi:hypothetical protein